MKCTLQKPQLNAKNVWRPNISNRHIKYGFEMESKLLFIPDFISMRVFVSISR